MVVNCKYNCGRVADIDFCESNDCKNLNKNDQYHIILIEKGSVTLKSENKITSFVAPCIVALKEALEIEFISSHLLIAKIICFDVSFLNINITYDLINTGEYDKTYENYGFIPLNIFYDRSDKYQGFLPLSRITFLQISDLFSKFNIAITAQTDKRWSCRARLHLNMLLELLHQAYTDSLNAKIAVYDIKDPNVWVSLILEKIHKDYAKNISLITLSKDMNINKTTVGKYFKSITGFPVTDYIVHYRIKCACYSLATTEITLKELAKECGFTREAYFIRQFKDKMGQTPTEYRKKKVFNRKLDFARK